MSLTTVRSATTQALSAASDTLITGMTITPGVGDYLAVFTAYLEAETGAKTMEFSLYVGGSQLAVSERRIDIESSISGGDNHTVLTLTGHVSPTAGQAVECRYRRTSGTSSATMQRRAFSLFSKASADFQEGSSASDQTINSGTDTLLTGTNVTPGAGDYLLLFSASGAAQSSGSTTANLYYSVYVNGSVQQHTERYHNCEGSISADLGNMVVLIACKVSPAAGQVVEIRSRRDGTINHTVHERTMTLMKVASGDIVEATATADQADTNTTDAVLNSMTLTAPGASEWLTLFSSAVGMGVISTKRNHTLSLYNGGTRDADSERIQTFNGSIDDGQYYIHLHEVLTVSGTDNLELQWKSSSTDTRTARERTLVAVREAVGGPTAVTISVTAANIPTVARLLDLGRSVSVTTSNIPTLVRALLLGRLISVTTAALPTLNRALAIARNIAPTVANLPSLQREIALSRVFDPTVSAIPSIVAQLVGAGAPEDSRVTSRAGGIPGRSREFPGQHQSSTVNGMATAWRRAA